VETNVTDTDTRTAPVEFEKKSVRRAMLFSPAAGVLGIIPYLFVLNLGIVQIIVVLVATLLLSYLLSAIFGAPGYFILKRMALHENKYLLAYAGALVILVAIAYQDVYALVSFAPPVLLVAGTFCYLRGRTPTS